VVTLNIKIILTTEEISWLRSSKPSKETKTVRIYKPYIDEILNQGLSLSDMVNVALRRMFEQK